MSAAHDWTVCHRCLGELFRATAARVRVTPTSATTVLMHTGCAAIHRANQEADTSASVGAVDPTHGEGWGSDRSWPPSRTDRLINGEAR